jgi:hypothetical protein
MPPSLPPSLSPSVRPSTDTARSAFPVCSLPQVPWTSGVRRDVASASRQARTALVTNRSRDRVGKPGDGRADGGAESTCFAGCGCKQGELVAVKRSDGSVRMAEVEEVVASASGGPPEVWVRVGIGPRGSALSRREVCGVWGSSFPCGSVVWRLSVDSVSSEGP